MKVLKTIVKILRWVGVGFFGIMALASLVSGGLLGALLFILGGALIAPLSIITKLRKKLKLGKVLSIILIIALFFGGVFAIPTSEGQHDTDITETASDDTSKEDITDTETEIETGTGTDISTETNDSSDTEDEVLQEDTSSKPDETQTVTCSHADTSVKNKSDATCTDNGYSGDTYCTSCGEVLQSGSQIAATGHNNEIRNKKDATTTSEGYTGDTYCKTCGTLVASGHVISKLVDDSKEETNSQIVYITATGTKYHSRKNCPGLSRAKAIYESTLEYAKSKGLGPCSRCH